MLEKLGRRRSIIIIGILFFVFAGGFLLISKKLQPGNGVPNPSNSIPLVIDSGLPQSPIDRKSVV